LDPLFCRLAAVLYAGVVLMDEETFVNHTLKGAKTCCGRQRSAEHTENRETLVNTLKNEGEI
jgi:hypothetical protein